MPKPADKYDFQRQHTYLSFRLCAMRIAMALFVIIVLACCSAPRQATSTTENRSDSDSGDVQAYTYPWTLLSSNIPVFPDLDTNMSYFDIKIFDRWGKKVAESKNPHFVLKKSLILPYDSIPEGTYFYQMTHTFRNPPSEKKIISGSIMILRKM